MEFINILFASLFCRLFLDILFAKHDNKTKMDKLFADVENMKNTVLENNNKITSLNEYYKEMLKYKTAKHENNVKNQEWAKEFLMPIIINLFNGNYKSETNKNNEETNKNNEKIFKVSKDDIFNYSKLAEL